MKIEDGLMPVYIKDGVIYPVIITEEQRQMLQISIGMVLDNQIVIAFTYPMGQAQDILPKLRADRDKRGQE